MADLNPFPDYPVTNIRQSPNEVLSGTVATPSVEQARTLVREYLASRAADKSDQPLIVGVRGDYGSGKTHLLLDTAATLREKISPDRSVEQFSFLARVACLETDPLSWYRQALGPELAQPDLDTLVVRLYAEAGRAVATQAELTVPAVAALDEDWKVIHKLVREHLLNVTAVEAEFVRLLSSVVPDVSEDVRRALGGLVWAETKDPARAWIGGQQIGEIETGALRLSKSLCDEPESGDLIVAIARLSSHFRQPFGLLIDELEHFTRYDAAHGSRANITWLKRLLEGLAAAKVVVFVAGHWNAWLNEKDFLDRFSTRRPIDMVHFRPDDVMELARVRVKNLNTAVFTMREATLIAEQTTGNARGVLAVCYTLYRETDGFNRPISPELIADVAVRAGQRITVEEAMPAIEDVLHRLGMTTARRVKIDQRFEFDLVASGGEEPLLACEFKRIDPTSVATDSKQAAAMRLFWERIKDTRARHPAIAGCFIVDGMLDPDLLSISGLASETGFLLFGLSQPDVLTAIQTALTARFQVVPLGAASVATAPLAYLASPSPSASPAYPSPQTTAAVEKQLTVLEDRRSVEEAELRTRISTQQAEQAASPRSQAVVAASGDVHSSDVSFTYSELTQRPTLLEEVRTLIGGPDARGMFIALLLLFGGIWLALTNLNSAIADLFYPPSSPVYDGWPNHTLLNIALYVVAVVSIIGGVVLLARKLSQFELFVDFRTRILRELYLTEGPHDLTIAANVIQTSLERYGVSLGRRIASEQLVKTYPWLSARTELLDTISLPGRQQPTSV